MKLKKQRNTPQKKELAFEDLFRDRDHANEIKQILKIKGYTINNQWVGITKFKTELLAAYYALDGMGFLKDGKHTTRARVIFNEFGLSIPGTICERSATEEPATKHIESFKKMFTSLAKNNS